MKLEIKLNDLLQFPDLKECKIRLVKSHYENNPIKLIGSNDAKKLDNWLLWNYSKKSFKVGQIVIGLLRIDGDRWVLFDIVKIEEDLNVTNGPGYKKSSLEEHKKFFGRVVVRYKNQSQNLIRKAETIIEDCVVSQILDAEFEDSEFPGYDQVNVHWSDLARLIDKPSWKTALQNQKGVYLITNEEDGRMYVGSAYGENMMHGRWTAYVKNGNGGNVELKKIPFEDIKKKFKYSILDIYKSSVDDATIISREAWWKSVLMTQKHGYNKN